MSLIAQLQRRGLIALSLLVGACAGKPAIEAADDGACPDLAGSYCAWGQKWEKSDTQLQQAHLPDYLGVESAHARSIDRVDIGGAADDTLTIVLFSGDQEIDRAVLQKPELVCGNDTIAMRMQTIPWGGGAPVLALGASAGWGLLQKHPDGSLRVAEQRNETGTVFLVIPVHFNSDSVLKFDAYAEGTCSR